MKLRVLFIFSLITFAAAYPAMAMADQTVHCRSKHHEYKFCPVETHGYVYIQSEDGRKPCRQGQNWDFDRRGIWVDNNCGGTFVVEARHHTKGHKDHNGEKAVAAVAALALVAAAASASSDKHNRYNDENYGRAGHSSYVPRWMVGQFSGYNLKYGTQVEMEIKDNGRMKAHVNGGTLTGYVNDQRAYLGDAEFYIEKAGDGFNTVQVGDSSNQVHYHRQ